MRDNGGLHKNNEYGEISVLLLLNEIPFNL